MFERSKELFEISTISFGHMVRRDNFKEELKPVLDEWKRKEKLFNNRASEGGSVTILVKCYDESVGLMEVNKVIAYIEDELDENCSSGNDFEENDVLKDFLNVSLMQL